MNLVLSVYNDWAFREVVLPKMQNIEYSFLLGSEIFHLKNNEIIDLDNANGKWIFNTNKNTCTMNTLDSDTNFSGVIQAGEMYGLHTENGELLAIMVENRSNPFNIYNKYHINAGDNISIGSDSDNRIQYRFPNSEESGNIISRHHCIIKYNGTSAVLEDMSSSGTYVNNLRVNISYELNYGDNIRIFGLNIIYLGDVLAINSPQKMNIKIDYCNSNVIKKLAEVGDENGTSKKTMFYRAPRIVPKIYSEAIEIDPPPTPRELPNIPLFMQIGPAMTMTIPMILGSGMTIVASRMSGMSNPALMMTGMITAISSASIGVFWAITNMRYNKKSIKEGEEKRLTKYSKYLNEKEEYIRKLYALNSDAYRERYISSDTIVEFTEQSEKLWNRNFNHSDVLKYRIGIGDTPFPALIEVPKDRFTMIEDNLAEKPRQIKDKFKIMHDVPVCVNLKENSLIGIIGDGSSWAQVINNLLVQIAGSNSYTDVKIAFVFDENKTSNPKNWEFVKWMPHIWSEDKKTRLYATNKNDAREVFYYLGQVFRNRLDNEDSDNKPYYILFILNKDLLEGELISKFIDNKSNNFGLTTIVAAEKYENLPNKCEYIIENSPKFTGSFVTIDENADRIPIKFDNTNINNLLKFSKCLANIEIDEIENGGEIPTELSFFDMYDINRPEELRAEERWRKSKISETMRAIIGIKNGENPCYLDIHERYHGPHGLVAGTTGSGKSETLQTYMLSLAINYSPDDVGFFIIDYKGGGMANLFEGMPHIIGAISNLSGNQVRRAMVSIKSENKRRQRLFTEHGVNNINAYTSLYKNGDAKEPIPHMLIIIDEFAELKREEPDFMRELISVAQVGRSLGVHLILATQKPAGTVDDNIWSNSKFKLCLRVQDRQDSMDMLHRADAAYLTNAGRGFLQVGNDEIFELFQSGYSGATYDEVFGNEKLVVAQMINSVGKVDLVGNHFKIQRQKDILLNWIKVLCMSIEKAISVSMAKYQTYEEIFISEDYMTLVYKYISEYDFDFKRNQYNDIRIRSFSSFLVNTDIRDEENKYQIIIDKASEKGIKLPELKSKSQLEVIKDYLRDTAEKNGYKQSLMLWMPVLPDNIVLDEIEGYNKTEDTATAEDDKWTLSAIIGKGDDPENQNQMPISIDFANNGNHAICGTISTGKSTFLQTSIYSIINKYGSSHVNIYIIDFSAKLLSVFSTSNHVGGIMTDSEEDSDKISKFFTMLDEIVEERKKILLGSSFKDYNNHSGKKLPAIVLVIDNYSAFKEKTSEKYEDNIKTIAKEGISLGIYLLVTAGGFGNSEISTKLADSFRTTLCLEMSDVYQYSDVMRVIKVPILPESNVKGRGLVINGDKIIEFQTALSCRGESIYERNENIKKTIEKINSHSNDMAARKIPVIPDKPTWEEYVKLYEYSKLISSSNLLPNGYNAKTAAYSGIDLSCLHTYIVSGTKKSGKTTYMKTLILSALDKGSDVTIIEIGSSDFKNIATTTGSRYIVDGQGIYSFAKDILLEEIKIRSKKKSECLAEHMEDAEIYNEMCTYKRQCIFITNVLGFLGEVYNRSSEAYNSLDVYESLFGEKGSHYNFYFFVEIGDSEITDAMGYKIGNKIKENGNGIRFGGKYLNQKLFNFVNIPYKYQSSPLKTGIGVVPSDDETSEQIQIVVPNYRG